MHSTAFRRLAITGRALFKGGFVLRLTPHLSSSGL